MLDCTRSMCGALLPKRTLTSSIRIPYSMSLRFVMVLLALPVSALFGQGPVITSISPASVFATGPDFTLTVNGSGFAAACEVKFGSSWVLNTTFVSESQLTARVPASLISRDAVTEPITVLCSGKASNTVSLTVAAPTPVITSLSPSARAAGGPTLYVTIQGTGLILSSLAYFNGTALQTSYQASSSGAYLAAALPPELTASPGAGLITVVNPGNATPSNALPFTVAVPIALTSIEPSSVAMGGPDLVLTLNGSGFAPDALAFTGGLQLATTFVSSNRLTAVVPAALTATAGELSVGVRSGGINAGGQTLAVTGVTPAITSVTPSSMEAYATFGVRLQLFGSGFLAGSKLSWAGTLLVANIYLGGSDSTYTAAYVDLPANLRNTAGAYAVAMINPGGVASNEVTVYVNPNIVSVTPSAVPAGVPDQTITVRAAGFRSGTIVHMVPPGGGDLALATTLAAGTLSATVPAGALVSAGTAKIYLLDPSGAQSRTLDFTITPRPSISSITPQTRVQSPDDLTVSVTGSGFLDGCAVQWNGAPIATTYVSPTQLNARVAGALPDTAGAAGVSVVCGGMASNSVTLTITPAPPKMDGISPTYALVDSPGFTLTVSGGYFVPGSVVFWDTTPLATAYLNAATATAQVPAALLLVDRYPDIKVVNPDGAASAKYVFHVNGKLTAVTPNAAAGGSPDLPITVSGAGFAPTSTVTFWAPNHRAVYRCATTYVDSHTVKAVIPAAAFAEPGLATIVMDPFQSSLPFTVTGTPVTINYLLPSSATVGSPGFTLFVTGSGFVSGSAVRWNSNPLATTFSSPTQLTANVPAALIADVGSASVDVLNPDNLTSAARPFSVNGPAATLTSISPASAAPGGPEFTLTVNGSQFYPGAAVSWNGGLVPTTFVSSTELKATIAPFRTAAPGVIPVVVRNAGYVASVNSLPFTIAGAATLAGMSTTSATAGDPGFRLYVWGEGFASDSVLRWNGTPLTTQHGGGSTQISADIPASLLATSGSAAVTVATGSFVSNALTFTINPRPPAITALNPSRVNAGGPSVTVTISGAGFAPGCTVTFAGASLSSTYVSATVLTAAIPRELVSLYGSFDVVVTNADGLASNAYAFGVNAVLTAVEPSEVASRFDGTSETVTITGNGFKPGLTLIIANLNTATVRGLVTTYVSPTQVTAEIFPELLRSPGEWEIKSDRFPSSSGRLAFGVGLPKVQSLEPASVVAGAPSFTLVVNGSNFTSSPSVLWNGGVLATTYISATRLTAAVPGSLLATPGNVAITVDNGVVSKPAAVFTITPAGASISSITPNRATAGDAGFTLAITGAGFASGAVAQWNGATLSTTVVSATQLTAAIPAALIASAGNANVIVLSAGLQSNPVAFTIEPAAPAVTSLSPNHAASGGAGFTLTVTGTGFGAAAVAQWNGSALATTLVSAGQLSATVPAALIATPGTAAITVVASGLTSNTAPFTIDAAPTAPVVTSEGIVNAASHARSIAPGSLISILGSGLAPEAAVPTGMPLRAVLKDVSVEIDGRTAPLLYVGPSQIYAQVPFETHTGSTTLVVRSGALRSAPVSIEVGATAPGVFQDASGHAISQNQDWSINTPAQPALPRQHIIIYMTGLGLLDNPVPTGSAAPREPLSRSLATVEATIGGKPANVSFAGLTPGQVGLFQVNLLVPDVPAGEQTLEIAVGGNASNRTTVSIR